MKNHGQVIPGQGDNVHKLRDIEACSVFRSLVSLNTDYKMDSCGQEAGRWFGPDHEVPPKVCGFYSIVWNYWFRFPHLSAKF